MDAQVTRLELHEYINEMDDEQIEALYAKIKKEVDKIVPKQSQTLDSKET